MNKRQTPHRWLVVVVIASIASLMGALPGLATNDGGQLSRKGTIQFYESTTSSTSQSSAESSTSTTSSGTTTSTSDQTGDKLPNTGEQITRYALWVGGALLVVGGWLLWRKKRKEGAHDPH